MEAPEILNTPTSLDHCWWLQRGRPVFILGGRYGDIILLSGCLHAIWKRTGQRPHMFTSKDYVSIYDGMSYVDWTAMPQNWWECVDPARKIADREFGGGVVVQWWNGTPANDDTIGFNGKNVAVLQSHGKNWGVNIGLDPDFGTSMARRLGFTRDEWLALPPVFDRRNYQREAMLVQRYYSPDRPMLLYNFTGVSSPFAYVPEMMRLLVPFRRDFNVVDLGQVRAYRIYDLLGLYEMAAGLITIDTATGHLAPATNVPVIWLTVPGWTTSVAHGNVAFTCKYNEVPSKLNDIKDALALLFRLSTDSPRSTEPPTGSPNDVGAPTVAGSAG